MLLLKKINNNVAIAATDKGEEIVVFGKGVGFHEMPFYLEDESCVQRKFYDVPESLYEILNGITDELLLASSDIANLAAQELGCELSPGLPFILADHLQFAVNRNDQDLVAPNPLAHEVESIYPRELAVGKRGVEIVEERTGTRIADPEATSIALHIVNAEVDGAGRAKDMDFIMKTTRLLDVATEIVESTLGIQVDRTSYAYIRFLAHLRFLARRLMRGKAVPTDNLSLFYQASRDFPEAYNCAVQIDEAFTKEFNSNCSEEELLYLMMHVNRLKWSGES